MNDRKLDDRISDLVRRVALDAPGDLEDKALAAARAAGALREARKNVERRPLGLRLWATLAPAAVLAGLAALIALPPVKTPALFKAQSAISEIRTEIELADKNIKIIFFQKPDFNLFKEN
jgi:hypothetical protein